MVSFTKFPIELLFKLTEYLDILSIIRLTWVSPTLHNNIGVSRSFWLRYCRILLKDERLPLSCFSIESLEVTALVKLATRKERLARATHASQWPGARPAKRTQCVLDHDPDLTLQRWSIHGAPGGQWVVALAWRRSDSTAHVLCWDVKTQGIGEAATISPVVSTEVRLMIPPVTAPELSRPWYDPESQSYLTFVLAGIEDNSGSLTKITPLIMECVDNHTPSFRITNEVKTLPRETGNRLKFSGRYAELHHPSGQLRSLVWDSKSGQTTSYPLEPHTATSFHTVVVTSGGTVFQVRGDVHEDRLITRFFRLPTGLTRATDYPAKIEIPSKGRGHPWLANSCTYAVTPHHIMRVIEGKTVTPMQVQCTTTDHDFSAGVAMSENGELYMLPLVDEPWRLNEHTVPMWMTHPALHFVLTEKPDSSRAVSITADHKELFLFAAPHSLYNGGKESGRGLLRVPTFSTDIGARTDRWACIGVCPRSGTWIFTRRAQDRWLATVIRSE